MKLLGKLADFIIDHRTAPQHAAEDLIYIDLIKYTKYDSDHALYGDYKVMYL